MTPKNKTENLLLWGAALGLAVVLSFLSALAQQLPGEAPINWRVIWLAVISTILTTAPLVAAGFGLPRIGKEEVAGLVSAVGTENAKAALADEADRQAGVTPPALTDTDIGRLAERVLAENEARQMAAKEGR